MKKEKETNQIEHTFEQTAHSFDSKHQKAPKNTIPLRNCQQNNIKFEFKRLPNFSAP